MSKPKRQFDSVSHSATGRVDTSKKGGHGTWGSTDEAIAQGKNEFDASKGGASGAPSGRGKNLDRDEGGDMKQEEQPKVSFEAYQQKQAKKKVKPYAIQDKNNLKKRNARNRTQAQKTTDSLFSGTYNNNNKNKNKKGGKNNNKNKKQNANSGQNAQNKKNRKAKEVLITSVTYEAPQKYNDNRGRGGYRGGRGGGRGRGGYNNGGGFGYSRGGGRGGGFGTRARGPGNAAVTTNGNQGQGQGQGQGQPARQQYRKVDQSSKPQNTNNNNAAPPTQG